MVLGVGGCQLLWAGQGRCCCPPVGSCGAVFAQCWWLLGWLQQVHVALLHKGLVLLKASICSEPARGTRQARWAVQALTCGPCCTQVGTQARLMSNALKRLAGSASKSNCTIIFLNQMRYKVSSVWGAGGGGQGSSTATLCCPQ